MIDVVVIGAGPYGLSVAAHLTARGSLKVFGKPMETWSNHMPPGMLLKSEPFATSLSSPNHAFPLEQYYRDQGMAYQGYGKPIPLEMFTAYGLAFQKRFVPDVDQRLVSAIERRVAGFQLTLDDGSTLDARRVVVAAGIRHYAYLPPEMADLPHYVSHSAQYGPLTGFAGKKVLVIGTGSSATDIAILLHQLGVDVTLIGRSQSLIGASPVNPGRPIVTRIKHPLSGIGLGWKSLAAAQAPRVFSLLPENLRLEIVRRHLGPAPGATAYEYASTHLHMVFKTQIKDIQPDAGKVVTEVEGRVKTFSADHVIAATGYRVDLRRLKFLAPILSDIAQVANTPKLSPHFESSITNLFFVGASAANTFGPLLRFVYGADWTAQRLARRIQRN